MAKAQYLEPIMFPEGILRFLRHKFWELNCNGLTSGSEVMGNMYKSIENIDDSKSSLIEHRYRYHLLAVQISSCLVENWAGLDFLKFHLTPFTSVYPQCNLAFPVIRVMYVIQLNHYNPGYDITHNIKGLWQCLYHRLSFIWYLI